MGRNLSATTRPPTTKNTNGVQVAKIRPSIRPTETYTETNFVRVHMAAPAREDGSRLATIEHLSYRSATDSAGGRPGWCCETIVDGEAMSREDALFIARSYAQQNEVPVIYECNSD